MKNHFNEKGDYINCENLSLAEIYLNASQEGYKKGFIAGSMDKTSNQPRGAWVPQGRYYLCSACIQLFIEKTPYCALCGAKMDLPCVTPNEIHTAVEKTYGKLMKGDFT